MRTCYNLVTVLLLLLTIATCALTALWLNEPANIPAALLPSTEIVIPTGQAFAFFTPSDTPTASDTPAPRDTRTPTPTWTPTNTQTATATRTPTSTDTPTETNTPEPTATTTEAASATATTQVLFPFELNPETDVTVAAEASGNCNFAGFAGRVVDGEGKPLNGVQLRISGAGLAAGGQTVTSGSSPALGEGGWQLAVAQAASTDRYTIRVISGDSVPLSLPYTYQFSGDCAENLVTLTYRQVASVQ